jgi:hypothetical protein
MIEQNAQQTGTIPPHLEINETGEGSKPTEEPDQRQQEIFQERELRNERIRLLIICIGLLVIILSAVLYLFTGSIVALFVTIVVVPLFYRCVDVCLVKTETSARRQCNDKWRGINHKDLSRLHPAYERTRRTHADNLYDG